MTPLRIALLVVVAVVVLFIGGCALFGLGTNSQGDLGDLLTTPTATTP
jgi:nitrogen fixation-related uncharacterized protein